MRVFHPWRCTNAGTDMVPSLCFIQVVSILTASNLPKAAFHMVEQNGAVVMSRLENNGSFEYFKSRCDSHSYNPPFYSFTPTLAPSTRVRQYH